MGKSQRLFKSAQLSEAGADYRLLRERQSNSVLKGVPEVSHHPPVEWLRGFLGSGAGKPLMVIDDLFGAWG